MTSRDDSFADRLSRALASAAPSEAFRDALTGPVPDVAVGQLWRAAHRDRSSLVLIVAAEGGVHVTVAPVTIDDGSSNDATDLDASSTSLAVPSTVWHGIERVVPTRTLHQFVGSLLLEHDQTDVLDRVAANGRSGEPIVSASDPMAVAMARLMDTLDILADAELPTGTGELAAILKETDVTPEVLQGLLTLSGPAVLGVFRGQRPLSTAQAEVLGGRIGRDAESLLHANPRPPDALLAWLSQPRQRRQVLKLAQTKGINEDAAFSSAAFSTFALAARTTGDREVESAWGALGERFFQSVLDE